MDSLVAVVAAFYAGMAGSAHCVGMCGGIATLGGVGARRPLSAALLFNAGRILSYALVGAVGGWLFGGGLNLAGFGLQRWVGVASGITLAMLGLWFLTSWRGLAWPQQAGARAFRLISPLAARLLPIERPEQALALGGIWGWMPCGLVYMMLPLAWATGEPAAGAMVMLGFGLGTAPAMVAVGIGGSGLRAALRRPRTRRWAGFAMLAIGVTVATMALRAGGPHNHAIT